MHPCSNFHRARTAIVQQPPAYRQGYSTISYCTANPCNPSTTNCYTDNVEHGDNNHEMEVKDVDSLAAIGWTLHSNLSFRRAIMSYTLSPRRHLLASSPSESQSINVIPKIVGHTNKKNNNSVFTASDLIGGGPLGSKLKDIMSNHLNASNGGDNMKSLLSLLGLNRSKNYLSFSQDRAVDEKIKAHWDPKGKGYGVVVGQYDNIGFRKRMGYVHFVMVTILFFPLPIALQWNLDGLSALSWQKANAMFSVPAEVWIYCHLSYYVLRFWP